MCLLGEHQSGRDKHRNTQREGMYRAVLMIRAKSQFENIRATKLERHLMIA